MCFFWQYQIRCPYHQSRHGPLSRTCAIWSAVSVGLEWPISTVNKLAKVGILKASALLLRAILISKVHLAFENLALRQEVTVSKQLATSRSTGT